MDNNKMFELAERLKVLRDEKDDMERTLKEINGEIDDAEYRLSELMAESETQSFTRAGTMFYLHPTWMNYRQSKINLKFYNRRFYDEKETTGNDGQEERTESAGTGSA